MSAAKPPFLGFGLGLRPQHYSEILNGSPQVDWFEVLSENYMVEGGQPLRMLDQICERYPVVMHGVSFSIASTSPLDFDYLTRLKALAARVNPKWIFGSSLLDRGAWREPARPLAHPLHA